MSDATEPKPKKKKAKADVTSAPAVKAKAKAKPKAKAKAERAVALEAASEPAVEVEVAAKEPKGKTKPKAAAKAKTKAKAKLEVEAAVLTEVEAAPEPKAKTKAKPEVGATVAPAIEPPPEVEPAPEPTPRAKPKPAPKPKNPKRKAAKPVPEVEAVVELDTELDLELVLEPLPVAPPPPKPASKRKSEREREREQEPDPDPAPEVEPERDLIGTVAIVGFPNVGKSTLINRLTESREAVVHETHGTTRDRKELVCEWNGKRFLLIDTGGVDIVDPSPITRSIADQARVAVREADLVLFVTDARIGITPGDEELATILRSAHKPVILLANKLDDPRHDVDALEFHRLGLGDPQPLSALHGHGTGDLLDDIVALLPGSGRPPVGAEAIRVAILGRPNVGKSSLLNALLGEERTIVSDIPGTTRDSIDTILKRGDRTFVLVDTAGLRRKRKQRQGIDYYSELRALAAAERSDVALVLVDSSEGVVEQDVAVADVARKANSSTVVVLSKWDATDVRIEEVTPQMLRRLRQRPPVIAVSAHTGRGIQRLLDMVEKLFEKHTARVSTAELNKILADLREARQAPARGGKRLNLLYGTQVSTRPPRFRLFVNDPGMITRDYAYWVENNLRERLGLEGVPVSIDFVRRA